MGTARKSGTQLEEPKPTGEFDFQAEIGGSVLFLFNRSRREEFVVGGNAHLCWNGKIFHVEYVKQTIVKLTYTHIHTQSFTANQINYKRKRVKIEIKKKGCYQYCTHNPDAKEPIGTVRHFSFSI